MIIAPVAVLLPAAVHQPIRVSTKVTLLVPVQTSAFDWFKPVLQLQLFLALPLELDTHAVRNKLLTVDGVVVMENGACALLPLKRELARCPESEAAKLKVTRCKLCPALRKN